jgi:hypothetical protein
LFLPGGSCVALQLQLCLVSSSPSRVGQFSFEYCPQSQETISGINHQPCFEKLACYPTPHSQPLCLASPLVVLVQHLWDVGLLPYHCSQPLLLFPRLFSESLAVCPTPVLWGRFNVPPTHTLSMLEYNLLLILFSSVGRGFNMPKDCTGLCSPGVGRGVTHGS